MSSKRVLGKESWSQYQVHNSLGPVKNENMGPFVQNLRTSKSCPQSTEASTVPSEHRVLLNVEPCDLHRMDLHETGPVSAVSQRKQGSGETSRSVGEELDLKLDSKT